MKYVQDMNTSVFSEFDDDGRLNGYLVRREIDTGTLRKMINGRIKALKRAAALLDKIEGKGGRCGRRTCAVCGAEFAPASNSQKTCSDECRRVAYNEYHRAYYKGGAGEMEKWQKRASGLVYENPPEKLAAIREKYKNGVPTGEVEKWLS